MLSYISNESYGFSLVYDINHIEKVMVLSQNINLKVIFQLFFSANTACLIFNKNE